MRASILISLLAMTYLASPALAEPPTMQEIAPLIQGEKWDEAIVALKQVTEANPEHGGAWFYLAYATHMVGDHKAALPLHRKAATFDQFRPVALYNVACAHALLGEKSKAVAALGAAIEAGFDDPEQIRGDADLKSLRGEAGYKALMRELEESSAPVGKKIKLADLAPERRFDFYAGKWNVDARGQKSKMKIEQILNNRVLQVTGPTSASLITYVPTLKVWKWTWVSNAGHHDVLVGGMEGDTIVMTQKVLRDRPNAIGRSTFSKIASDSFELDWEVSTDGGKTWNKEYHARYTRAVSSNESSAAAARLD